MLEEKVKQAAQSLRRLENAANKRQRISLSLSAAVHLDTAQKKCDEINAELWRLSSLSMEIERKLLNHNAAVLGLGMSILEKKELDAGSIYEFGQDHLYLSQDRDPEHSHPARFSITEEKRVATPALPTPDVIDAQNRLRELNLKVATIAQSD